MKTETIAAIATAQGQGGIGVIRISGEEAIDIADKIFKAVSGKKLKEIPGYTAKFGKVCDKDEEVDEAVALVFRAPHSYTGENVVEVSCHGGLYITKRILRLIFEAGARPAEPGEFTKRAFLNGKIDLIKAESVMKIIEATGKNAARVAVAVNEGAISKKVEVIMKELLELSARLSVWADYPDDESIDVDFDSVKEILIEVKRKLEFLIKNYDTGKVLINGVKTAIVGAPNVGKSTLMNMLSGVEKSIVTDIPGTTRDIVEETVNRGDLTLRISDTAGIRETSDLVENIGVNRAKACAKFAELVLFVIDGSRELTEEEIILLKSIKENKSIVVLNKCDLIRRVDGNYLKDFAKEMVEISAKNGEGIEFLKESILKVLGTEKIEPSEGILVSERQFIAVKNVLKSIEEAQEAINMGLTLDAVTVSINDALDELFELTGEKVTQVVVDKIFSDFCVGK